MSESNFYKLDIYCWQTQHQERFMAFRILCFTIWSLLAKKGCNERNDYWLDARHSFNQYLLWANTFNRTLGVGLASLFNPNVHVKQLSYILFYITYCCIAVTQKYTTKNQKQWNNSSDLAIPVSVINTQGNSNNSSKKWCEVKSS